MRPEEESKPKKEKELTQEVFDDWVTAALGTGKFKAVQKVFSAFSSAVAVLTGADTSRSVRYVFDSVDGPQHVLLAAAAKCGSMLDACCFEKNMLEKPYGKGEHGPVLSDGKWEGLMKTARAFWTDAVKLLGVLQHNDTLAQDILMNFAAPSSLKWLLPFDHLTVSFLNCVTDSWAFHGDKQVRLSSFLVLHSAASMLTQPEKCKAAAPAAMNFSGAKRGLGVVELEGMKLASLVALRLQRISSTCFKKFTIAAEKGLAWRNRDAVRFAKNCIVELLRLDGECAYRVAFVQLRQMAVGVRNSLLAPDSKPAHNSNSGMSLNVYGPNMVEMCSLWVEAMKAVPELHPLGFPLSTIVAAVVDSLQGSESRAPLALYLLQVQCDLSRALSAFVPIGSQLFLLGQRLASHGGRGRGGGGGDKLLKPEDVDASVSLDPLQLKLPRVQEALYNRWIEVLYDYTAALASHPSFPEASLPLLDNARKIIKTTKQDIWKTGLKEFVVHAEAARDGVTQRRQTLDLSTVPVGKLLVFDNPTPLSKKWKDLRQRHEEDVRSRVVAAHGVGRGSK